MFINFNFKYKYYTLINQYHEKKGTKKYKEGITKLAKSTITKEKYNKTCNNPLISNSKPDENLSEYLGKNVFVSTWPVGGEIDILEQTNFSDTNLLSVHGGPICEVVNGYDNNYYIKDENIDLDYRNSGVRSVCGVTYWNGGLDPNNPGSYGIGPYSGCKDNTHKIGELGGSKSITKNGVKRYNCPKNAATSAGNSQVVDPVGSFGTVFNQNGGGVYVVDWSPKKHLNIWWFSRQFYSKDFLSTKNGPLSSDPKPDKWSPKMFPSIKNTMGKYKKQKVLIASYILNSNNALNEGCDFNYQGITINISLGGDWAGNVMPEYCSVDYKSEWTDYITKCYNASAKRASKTVLILKTVVMTEVCLRSLEVPMQNLYFTAKHILKSVIYVFYKKKVMIIYGKLIDFIIILHLIYIKSNLIKFDFSKTYLIFNKILNLIPWYNRVIMRTIYRYMLCTNM